MKTIPAKGEKPLHTVSGNPSHPRVLVIVPAFNEQERIGGVILSIRKARPDADIIVVDDGSIDRTSSVAIASGAAVARHVFNLGYGATIQTGYKYAIEKRYEMVVQLDADGQHDPGSIDSVIKPIAEGQADVVVGSRFLHSEGYQSTLERRIGSWLFGWVTSLMTGRRITDPTSGYLSMNRKALDICTMDSFPHDYPDADVLITLYHAGLEIVEVPVLMHPRQGGSSQHRGLRPIYYIFKMSLSIFVTMFRRRPRIPE